MFDSVVGFYYLGLLINSVCFCFDVFNDIVVWIWLCENIDIFSG